MKRTRLLVLAIVLFSTSCQRDGGIIGQSRLPGVTGTFVFEDDNRTVALASVQHSVFYEVGNERKLIFKGAGADRPQLSLIAPDTILLRYCGGWIYNVDSSFDDQPLASKGVRILHLQVVTVRGMSINGRPIC